MNTLPPHAHNGNIPNVSGIYKITCIPTKKIYIGSAVNLYTRRYDHFSTLRRNKNKNPYLQHAYNKYGEEAFTFEVLELVLIPEMLTAREQYWFGKLNPFGKRGYNIARVAGSNLGRHLSPETCEKIRQSHLGKKLSPEHAEKSRMANIGRKRTPEFIEKQRARKRTPETLAKLRSRRWTPEQREKLRAAKSSPEVREKMRQAQLGKSPSPETREKLRQAGLGKKMSPESIEKMRQSWIIRKAKKKES